MRSSFLVGLLLAACLGEVGGPDAPDSGSGDAGLPDAGATDAGAPDGGAPDGGTEDGGRTDGGTEDGGRTDSGTEDSGTEDGGTVDAGMRDGGPSFDGGMNADSGVDAGPAGVLSISPQALTFAPTPVGSSEVRPVMASNTGGQPVTVSQVAVTGPFSVTGLSLPLVIAPGRAISFDVRFSPTRAGPSTGELTVQSDASNPLVLVPLQGRGQGATVYPAPTGEPASPLFQVSVIDGSGIPQPSFVNFSPARQVTTAGWHGTDAQTGRSFSWTTFETDLPVRVRVTKLQGSFSSVQLRPKRYGLTATVVNSSTIEFTASPTQKISVEFDSSIAPCSYALSTCVRDILMVFPDRRESPSAVATVPATDIYRPAPGLYATPATISGITAPLVSTLGNATGKRVVVFGPGVYTIGYWQVPPNVEQVHLEGGAVVYGALEVLPLGAVPAPDDYLAPSTLPHRPSFKLTGHGILSGQKVPWHTTLDMQYCADDACGWWKMIRLVRYAAFAMTIEDVTLAASPYWTVAPASLTDPRVVGHFSGFKIVAGWALNNDGVHVTPGGSLTDCFMQMNDDGANITGSNIVVDGCVMWNFENGGTFQTGWYPKTLSNVRVRNVDVVHHEGWWGNGDTNGIFMFYPAAGAGRLSDIQFTQLTVEGPLLRLIGLHPLGGQQIDNVTFNGVDIDSFGNDIFNSNRFNMLNGTDGGTIRDVTFRSVRVGGQPLLNASQALMQINGNVSNVTFVP